MPVGGPVRFYGRAGGTPCVLLFGDARHAIRLEEFAAQLVRTCPDRYEIIAVIASDLADAVAAHDVAAPAAANHAVAECVGAEGAVPGDAVGNSLSFANFSEPGTAVSAAYGVLRAEQRPWAFVLDPNLRILQSFDLGNPSKTAAAIGNLLRDTSPAGEPRRIEAPAPVLVVPEVVGDELRASLIEKWKEAGSVATGVELSLDGQRLESVDKDHKKRRDHIVADPEVLKQLTASIGQRVLPEVQKAFAYRATRFEGFKIVRYGADDGGFFHAHRDNLSPATAHRRFGLTINLNDGYDGGHLRFPEYGADFYRPDAGGALLFSCSLLHEVLPVTSGERFALLSFLFDVARPGKAAPAPK